MAADKVSVLTKKAGEDQAYLWESEGVDTFTVTEAEKDDAGTTVTLHLKDDFKNYLEYWTVSSVVRKYSDFIEYPIRMAHKTKDKDGKDVIEDDTLNTMKAIWLRPESEVTEDEYNSFYSHLSGDYEAPLKRIVFSAEGASEFKALLFLSAKLPFQYQFGVRNKKTLSLYVKRVFITDECPGMLPDYMNGFVSGVVDSSDLPLNISRETLQDNPQIKVTVVANTAMAARMVADSDRSDVAAISSPDCAGLYGLSIIRDDIMNSDHNYTRFICISKNLEIFPGASKISMMMSNKTTTTLITSLKISTMTLMISIRMFKIPSTSSIMTSII